MRAINSSQHASRSKGFTLLEMLIALSLFALIGILSNRLLTTTLQIDERMERQFNEQLTLRQLFLILHDDLEQMVPRQTRTPSGLAPIFFQESSADQSGDQSATGSVSFVRGGYGNNFAEDTKRSRLVRVRYQVGKHPDRDKPDSRYYRDETSYLLRSISTTLDVNSATDVDDVVVQALLPNISRFNLLPLFGGGTGFGERALPLLPKSVLLELSGQSFGSLTHTIMVR